MTPRRALWLGLALGGALACGELFAPPLKTAVLSIAPDFSTVGITQAEVDRLRVRVFLDSAGAFESQPKVDSTLAIQGDSAVGSFTLPILTSPVRALVLLDAIRSSDGVVLFSGQDTVEIKEAGDEPPEPVSIDQFTYTGPTPVSIAIAPKDTVVEDGTSFTFRATALDSDGGSVPVRFYLVSPTDGSLLTVDRLTGEATAPAGAEGEAYVHAITADSSLADTARVLVGAVPVGVLVTPGYGNVGVGGTLQLTGAVVDGFGRAITLFPVSFTARHPSIATVDANGLVTGVAPGTAVIAVTADDFPAFADSALVTVAASGEVVVSTTAEDRGFVSAASGGEVLADVTVDMAFTASELLGSYNATLTWNPSVLTFVEVLAGDFPAPEVNSSNAGAGELRFAQANPSGQGGAVVVARVRFSAAAAGSAGLTLTVSEMSAAQTFTNLIGLVTVTNGFVTVR